MTDAVPPAASAPTAAWAAPPLFAVAIFASAALVFLVEPMVARLTLPRLGGSPQVWNTSLAFLQIALLAGYGYAHLLQKLRTVRGQAVIHILVLLGALLTLPLRITAVFGADPGTAPPTLWLLAVLAVSIGAPFAALSATAPLVQAWYAKASVGHADAENPYVLYAASNLGSLLALLAYPIVVEPTLSLREQTVGWSSGYVAFILLMIAVAWVSHGSDRRVRGQDAGPSPEAPPVSWRERLIWLGLSAIPSSLMLGVTTHITTDIASTPFLWVIPLALYLVTFIIAFQRRPLVPPGGALLFQAAALAACAATVALPNRLFLQSALIQLICFFLSALVCHQALAARRPPAGRLTEFYLLMSLGGVIGGGFNAFLAPLLFKTVFEYPLALVLVCLARPWGRGPLTRWQWATLAVGLSTAIGAGLLAQFKGPDWAPKLLITIAPICAFLIRDRALAMLALIAAIAGAGHVLTGRQEFLLTERSFFGVLRLSRTEIPGLGEVRLLAHGSTLHGAQAVDPARRCMPMVYYAPPTPIGQVVQGVQARKPAVRFGVVGMGTGSLAAYTRPADTLTFFEIDPVVERISEDPANLTYIHGCAKGRIDTVTGDARLTLGRQPAAAFDVLVIDAFTSDSVPAHLLTVQAMRLYLDRIAPDGVVILHLSNRHLDLVRPVEATAAMAGGYALFQEHVRDRRTPLFAESSEDAVIVARNPEALTPYKADSRWTAPDPGDVRAWTDDYTNLFGALVRTFSESSPKRP